MIFCSQYALPGAAVPPVPQAVAVGDALDDEDDFTVDVVFLLVDDVFLLDDVGIVVFLDEVEVCFVDIDVVFLDVVVAPVKI